MLTSIKLLLKSTHKYLSKINYTYLTTSCLLPLASCLLPIFTRKLILHDYLTLFVEQIIQCMNNLKKSLGIC
jgi:hypothetical protein